MFEKLRNIIGIFPDLYRDLRYEKNRSENISVHNGQIRQISKTSSEGAHFRLLTKGGMSVYSTTRLDTIPDIRKTLIADAEISASHKQRKIIFDPVAPVKDDITINPRKNPLSVPIKHKLSLLSEYCRYIMSHTDYVTMSGSFTLEHAEKFFASSEGSEIRQDQLYSAMTFNVYIRTEYGDLQNLSISLGGNDDFEYLENQYGQVDNFLSELSKLKKAVPITGGRYNVILNPQLAGVFIHEAFGHLSEAEHIYYSEDLKNRLRIGSQIGPPYLNVIDDPSIPNVPGYYKYDDEGISGKKTYIIKDGIINSYLNDRDSAHYFGQELTGHCRAGDYASTPIIRMSNIYIDKGKHSPSQIFDSLDEGYYLLNARGGQTVGNHFTFGAQYGYRIKKGRKMEMVKDINISGELFSTLMNIKMIADDFEFDKRGGCGKDGQLISKSATGSSHIRIDNVAIGGKL